MLSIEISQTLDVVRQDNITYIRIGDGIMGNAGFGSGQTLLELHGSTGLTATNLGLNLASTNTAQFAFT